MFRVLNCLEIQHDWRLVVLAGLICFLASGVAVGLFNRARALRGSVRVGWLLTASFATGSGIWATHFIAMLAFDPGIPIGFGVGLTVLSLLVAILVTSIGLVVAIYGGFRSSAAAGGAIIGGGIACMHYLGIAAVQMAGVIVWSADLVAVSIVLGVVFGAAALELATRSDMQRGTIAAAGVLALAIVSHHFVAMGAAGIIPGYVSNVDPAGLTPSSIALGIASFAAAVLSLCMFGIWSDSRNREKVNERNQWLDAAIDNMIQGLCMFDAQNRLMVWNERYRAMYHIDPTKIWRGCTIRCLLDARTEAGTFPLDAGRYDAELRAALQEGRSLSLNITLADGRIIHVVNQPIKSGGWVATHEDITERKIAERELEGARAFLDTIIENVPSPIIVKSLPEKRYVLINKAAEAHLGVKRDTMIGRLAREFMPADTAAVIDANDQKMIESGKPMFRDEHTILTPGNGTRIATSARLPLFGPDGKPQYLISVINDITDRKRNEQRIEHMRHHDALTGLPNRAAFNSCIAATMDLAQSSGDSFALLAIDIDRFKAVNDVFGHTVGDALLCEVARRMETACPDAFLARIDGDEFAVITPTGQQPAVAEAIAARLNGAFAGDLEVEGHRLRVNLTVGVGIYPRDGANADTLVANANAALFRAQAEARGSVRFFEEGMDNQLRATRLLQEDLRLAILRDELELHYQPQADIKGVITGFEALVRWHHPRHGVVPPSTFIPLAEESGTIIALGEWVLRTACREAASWPRPLSIAVNLSPVQFQSGDLPHLVHQVLLETGLSAKRLELEITEGMLIGDFARAVTILRRLKNLGARIAMDDFGTGYSSLSYLQSFPFDKIKIDRAFINNLTHSEQAATIIRAVIALGRGLNVPVTAEGVETEEQLQFLAAEGCEQIQGYLFGRPQPIAEYADIVGRGSSKPVLKIVGKTA